METGERVVSDVAELERLADALGKTFSDFLHDVGVDVVAACEGVAEAAVLLGVVTRADPAGISARSVRCLDPDGVGGSNDLSVFC